MARSRVPSPKDVVKVRRLKPKEGDQIQLTATMTKLRPDDNPLLSKVTLQVDGYAIPITLTEHTLLGGDD